MIVWMTALLEKIPDFSNILNVSIAAGWMVMAVIILRFLLKKAPKWIRVALWGLVAVRLLLPFSIESAFSLIPSAETVPKEILSYEGTQLNQSAYLDVVSNPVFSGDVSIELGQTADRMQGRMVNMTFVWLAGIAAMLLYTAFSYWNLHRKVDTAILYKEKIFQSENVVSPFVLGLIRPKIYLPFKLDGQDLEYVVAHEQAHIARKDHWWKPFGFLLLTIHWFNPLMWLAYVLLCRDIELACDEKVIKEFGSEQRADYTQALVTCSVNRRMIAACPLAFGEAGVKERVKSVMNYKKPAFWVVVLAAAACVIVAVCFLTNPTDKAADEALKPIQLSAEQTESIEAVQFDGFLEDASKMDVKGFMKSLSEVTPIAAEDVPQLEEWEFIVTLHGEDGSKESFYFYRDAESKDKWYMKTEDQKFFQNAEFLTEYINVPSEDALKEVTVGIPNPDTFDQVLELQQKLKEAGVTYSTTDMRALLAMEIQSQKALWNTEEEAVQGAKNNLTLQMAQYEYAVRQGYTLSEEELEARALKEDTMMKEASGFSEVEQYFEQNGTTYDGYQQDRKEYRRIQLTIANLYEKVYNEYRHGNIRIGDRQAKNMNEYWSDYLMLVVFPETEAYTNETLKPLLDEAESFYQTQLQ